MVAVLTLLSRRLPPRLRTNKDRSRWARHYGWPRTTRCRCYKRAGRMMFWGSFDPWTFLQSSARAARRTFRWNGHRSAIRPFTALAAVIGPLALISTSILEDSAKVQFAALNHYREETRNEQWPYTSRLVFTASCSVPSASLQVSERKTLTTSSNGSVNELTSVDTDAYRSSVAMPMLMWVSLVFQVWLPQMFAQHPLQSEDTIQHVNIVKGMYSDTLLNVIFMALSNTFFWNTPTFYGVTGNTRIDYNCVLEHFYLTSHRARFGEEQETHCKLYKPINGVITDLWYS